MHLVMDFCHQLNYLGVTYAFKIYCKVYLNHLWFLDQSHNLYIRSQGPSSSSINWPSLDYHTFLGMWPLLWTLPIPNAFLTTRSNWKSYPPLSRYHIFKFQDWDWILEVTKRSRDCTRSKWILSFSLSDLMNLKAHVLCKWKNCKSNLLRSQT
jgi:hypothetical protein